MKENQCLFLADDCIPKIVWTLICTWNFPQCEKEFHTKCKTTVQKRKNLAVPRDLSLEVMEHQWYSTGQKG